MTAAGALLAAPIRAAAMQSTSADGTAVSSKRLDTGWQFRREPMDGIWEIWRSEENDLWQPAALPHCFNATDSCDPDQPYYRGPGWYRTRLALENPFADGRTILHFQGAGQTTTLWVGSTLIGTHKGG
jgi:beta-galactosidase